MSEDTPLLIVEGVDKSFGTTRALHNTSLRVQPGEVHALLGENGAGKSTLMNILAGALKADEGIINVGGQAYTPDSPLDARCAGVAMVHQEPQLCDHLSVAENISLGGEPERWGWVDRVAMAERARVALQHVAPEGGIDPQASAGALPPGDRQLVTIARALSQGRLRLLILDEPTSSLTSRDSERLFKAVARLRDDGRAIVYISHFLEEVERVADAFTVLRDGTDVGCGAMAEATLEDLVTLMVGHNVENGFTRSPCTPGKVVVELDKLAGVIQPRACSLSLHEGEVVGIFGLVGAGRTEALRVLYGLDNASGGTIKVGGYHGWAPPRERLSQGMGMVSEDRKDEGLAADLSIAENMTLSNLSPLLRRGLVSPRLRREAAQLWVKRLDIRCQDVDQPVSALSGGNQQKVAIARLLYHDVDVLLLDEPTRGIDIKSRAAIYELIDELASKGKAILVVSSYLPELLGLCDRIAVMKRGHLGEAVGSSLTSGHLLLAEASGA